LAAKEFPRKAAKDVKVKKNSCILTAAAIIAAAPFACGQTFPIPDGAVFNAFAGRTGTFVMIDCASGAISDFDREASLEKLPPCSTFKIWNILIGLESGVISAPDAAFYKWDGEIRPIPEWNNDLTLKEAFQASCVPAFQELARKIGQKRMRTWIRKIGYGTRDISAGIDVFWLPAKGRKTILISTDAQAKLMCQLVSNRLPFSGNSLAVLKEIMAIKKTDKGILYGKTGSRANEEGKYIMGWFVGYVESNQKTYAFACNLKGINLAGKDARAIVEQILETHGML
jgi:beta-lactamase class D